MVIDEIKYEALNYEKKLSKRKNEVLAEIRFNISSIHTCLSNLVKRRWILDNKIQFQGTDFKIKEIKIFLKFCEKVNEQNPDFKALFKLYNKLSKEFKVRIVELDKLMHELWLIEEEFYNYIFNKRQY